MGKRDFELDLQPEINLQYSKVNLINRINAMAKLGEILRNPDPEHFRGLAGEIRKLNETVKTIHLKNSWFTEESVLSAMKNLGHTLKVPTLEKWVKKYDPKLFEQKKSKSIGVIMAGNIPLVGFHDYLSVLISGHKLIAKLSSDDNILLPVIHNLLVKIEPAFKNTVIFAEGTISGFDAVIATGSNNSSRYFEFYFGKYPHLIRKNRSSVAVIGGIETGEELHALCNDIFSYFGLGCRNVSKLFVPRNYKFDRFFEAAQDFVEVINHHKYRNNYDYVKAVYLVNKTPHLDNGFLILKEDTGISSPVSVLFYEHYQSIHELREVIKINSERIQCVVSSSNINYLKKNIQPGKTQLPALWDYADNVDTMEFLTGLK